ncbi:MAG TPA: HAMP domain-containing sensor histidine kinase, partial [Phycisphaerae bacterium]|nr:HAMP domain-containing sensor histidine kinase [Phycisphaerae bacterium]
IAEVMRFVDIEDVRRHVTGLSSEELAILEMINQKVAARTSLEDVIDFVFESTLRISPCDRIALALLEDHGGRIVSHYAKATYEPLHLKKGYAEDLHGGTLRTVLERRMPRIISDLPRYLAAKPESNSTRLLVREGVRSSMTCPLLVEDRVVGVLFRSSRRPNAYDDRQVLLHQVVAERLSQAVEKTLRIERLAAANRDYFSMLAFVTHELKSPLASMMLETGMLREGMFGALQPQQQQHADKIMAKGKYMISLIQQYLNLARTEGGKLELNVREVDLSADVIEPSIAMVQAQIDGKGMKLVRQVPDPPLAAKLDPELIKIVLVNLLGNAAKYGVAGGEIRLRVALGADRLTIAVWNAGPGFAASESGRLFRKFSRLESPELRKEKGAGIGLYTSWRIVHAHGGRIFATSEQGSWAEFTFEIPQPPGPPAEFD